MTLKTKWAVVGSGILLGISLVGAQAEPAKAKAGKRRWLASIQERSHEYAAAFNEGCSKGLETFCDDLFSADGLGNLDLKVGDDVLPVRYGENDAGLDYAYVFWQQAKLAARDRLPEDLRSRLDALGYFTKLSEYVAKASGGKPDRNERRAMNRRSSELSSDWTEAVEAVAMARFEKDHPGFAKKDPAPVAEEVAYSKLKGQFDIEIYKAIWEQHPRLLKLKQSFEQMKDEYVQMLSEIKAIPDDVKKDWSNTIKTIELTFPGEIAIGGKLASCPTQLVNAFYLPTRHKMVVCGGALGSQEVIAVLAHEISHSLDPGAQLLRYKNSMDFHKEMLGIWKNTCEKSPLTACPTEWKDLRDRADRFKGGYAGFTPVASDFLGCLQYKFEKITKSPTPEIVQETAGGIAASVAGDFADDSKFLSLTKSKVIDSKGHHEDNADYLNPCGTKTPKDYNFSVDNTIPLVFTLEYVCDAKGGSEAEKIDRSIATAIDFQASVTQKTLTLGGRFSDNPWMAQQGYAENVKERFADAMGYRVFSRMLKKEPDVENRRKIFLSNNAIFCDPPSLEREFPEEAQAEKKYSLEPHSSGKRRRLETLTPFIREALNCNKDFDIKDCTL